MTPLFWLSDQAWARHLPRGKPGKPHVDDRRVISGILHVLKTGCRWRDVPPEYGPATTVYNRYNRWSQRGLWRRLSAQARWARIASSSRKARRPIGTSRPRSARARLPLRLSPFPPCGALRPQRRYPLLRRNGHPALSLRAFDRSAARDAKPAEDIPCSKELRRSLPARP